MKAATTCSSAAPYQHISLIRSSVRVDPLQPKSPSKPTDVVFNRDMSSSMALQKNDHFEHAKHISWVIILIFYEKTHSQILTLTHQTVQENCCNWQQTYWQLEAECRILQQHCQRYKQETVSSNQDNCSWLHLISFFLYPIWVEDKLRYMIEINSSKD